jgi:aspartate 1-decarboxylase
VTGNDLHYEGSIAIDENLLEAAGLFRGEQVQVLNLNNAARFITYTIQAERGSGTILLNGPAARLAVPGDIISILAYGVMDEQEAGSHVATVIHVDEANRIVRD